MDLETLRRSNMMLERWVRPMVGIAVAILAAGCAGPGAEGIKEGIISEEEVAEEVEDPLAVADVPPSVEINLAGAAGTSETFDDTDALLLLVNQARCSQNPPSPPLTRNELLDEAGRKHSLDMAVNGYFDHISQDGRSPGDRITAEGYVWWTVGENIAAGQTSVEQVFDAWMNSSGHRKNILNANFREMGLGHISLAGTLYIHYWTQTFGTEWAKRNDPAPSCDNISVGAGSGAAGDPPTQAPTATASGSCTPGPSADCQGANLDEMDLSELDLRRANFRGASLRDALLSGARLQRASFRGADLSGADLSGAVITGTNFVDAIFCETTMPNGSVRDDDC